MQHAVFRGGVEHNRNRAPRRRNELDEYMEGLQKRQLAVGEDGTTESLVVRPPL